MKPFSFVLIAAFCLFALPLAAEINVFELFDMPSFMPGTMFLAIDEDAGKFWASYRIEPYMSHLSFGYIEGRQSGGTLTGDWYQVDADGTLQAGTITMTYQASDNSFWCVPVDYEGNSLRNYYMEDRAAGDEDDYETFQVIKDKVERAFSEYM